MGKCIIKIRDRYFEWSTVVDAPCTYGLTESELRNHIRRKYGEEGLRGLPARLKRANLIGTSALGYGSVEQLIAANRAGENEAELSAEEIYARYSRTD